MLSSVIVDCPVFTAADKPRSAFRRSRRHGVRSVEFPVFHRLAALFRARERSPARRVDRQDLIGLAVRDEDARPAARRAGDDESGRARDDVREEVAVGEPDRQPIASAIGKSADRQPSAVDVAAVEVCASDRFRKSMSGP